MADNKSGEGQTSPSKTFPIMVLLQGLFALINIGVVGIGTYLVYISTLGWQSPQITEEQLTKESEQHANDPDMEMSPLIYTMDKFTVNLKGEPKRTLQIEVNLEMLGKDGFEEVMARDNVSKSRDKIIRTLEEKKLYDLESIQGKLTLKEEIAQDVNELLDQGVVKDVYFTDFIVQ